MKLLLETWKRFTESTLLDEKYDPTTIARAVEKFKKDPVGKSESEVTIQKYIEAFDKYRDRFIKKDIFQYSWDELKKALESKYPVRDITKVVQNAEVQEDLKPIYDKNNLQIFLGDLKERCILVRKKLEGTTGLDYNWCVARDKSANFFNRYRLRGDQATFYYVYDADKPLEDNFHAVIIYPTQAESNEISYNLAPANNSGDMTLSWDEVIKRIPKLENLQNLFKVIPYSQKEKELQKYLAGITDDEFEDLTYDQKETFIDQGLQLSESRIRSLFNVNRNLVNKFCISNEDVLIPLDIYKKMPPSMGKYMKEKMFDNKSFFEYYYEGGSNIIQGGVTISFAALDVLDVDIKVEQSFYMSQVPVKEIRGNIEAGRSIKLQHFDLMKIDAKLKAGDELDLSGTKIENLPEVQASEIILKGLTTIKSLPDNLITTYLDLENCSSLLRLPKGLKVKGALAINGTKITEIPPDLQVYDLFVDDPSKLKIPMSAKIRSKIVDKEGKNHLSILRKIRSFLPEDKMVQDVYQKEAFKMLQELFKIQEERKLGKPSSETNLRDWFKRKGAPGKKGGWVDCNTCRNGKCKPCGRQEGESRSKYPRCRPTPSQCKGYSRRGDNLQKESNDKD